MIYSIQAPDSALLAHLWAQLWERGREELRRLGHDAQFAFDAFSNFMGRSDDAFILCADGNPVLATGSIPDGAGHATFFQATQQFDRHAKTITKILRRRTAESAHNPLYIYSVLVHTDAERWFGLLGYVRDGWCSRTMVGWPLYRFVRS